MTLDDYKRLLELREAINQEAISPYTHMYYLTELVEVAIKYDLIAKAIKLELDALPEEDQFTYIMTAGYPE
ncbi:hypothetical protein LZ626_19400 [Aeromonas allosaccharophila]|uniref:hypothetical protein n=1 Tax=Aeromonas allosaccharophila TaxID=656 RepID=UPI001F474FE8|nr:hypothetical protein [Aeromonas allosaccharophila]MCE9850244.1 hypothetical protein [Aeromonas allosaccharophila]